MLLSTQAGVQDMILDILETFGSSKSKLNYPLVVSNVKMLNDLKAISKSDLKHPRPGTART